MFETEDQQAIRYLLGLNSQLQKRITELENTLAHAELVNGGTGGAIEGILRTAMWQRERDQLKNTNLETENSILKQATLAQNNEIEALKSTLSTFFPHLITQTPHSAEEMKAFQAKAESDGNKIMKTTYGQVCAVSIVVHIRPKWDDVVNIEPFPYFNLFPGSPDEAKREILPRIKALIRRAPMFDNLRPRSISGVKDTTLLDGLSRLADWWHVTDFRESDQVNYVQRLKDTFDQIIRPEVNWAEITEAGAYDRWRKTAEESFHNMAKFGRGRSDKPTTRPSRKHSNYKGKTLRRNSS